MTDHATGLARAGCAASDLKLLTVALAADALDRLGERDRVMVDAIRPLAAGTRLIGWARTVDVRATDVVPDAPYVGEMAAIAALRPGDVIVYHVDRAVRAALFGELFSVASRNQGAVGAVLDGPVRDVRQIRELGFPVFTTGASPYDTKGRAEVVAHDVPVACGGVGVATGDLVVADDDGVVVIPARLAPAVVAAVAEHVSGERGALGDLLAGATVQQVWTKWGVF